MVRFLQGSGRLLAGMGCVALLCQCTTREVKSTRSSFSFAGDGDRDEIRQKYAESGYSVDDEGNIVADNPDLYADRKPRGLDGAFETKEAKFRKDKSRTKMFPTPEYIKRQEYKGVSEARDAGLMARESDFDGSRDRQSGRLFGTRSDDSSNLGLFRTDSDREAGRAFATNEDRANEALQSAAVAEGTSQQTGYTENAGMTMNDVKKLVTPNVYARATGIDR